MGKIWFTSDTHFFHANIIKYCNRPFKDVYEMNDNMINNFNSQVNEDDTIFFLGDFIFRNSPGGKPGEGEPVKVKDVQDRLKGKWIFVKGNHDRNNSLKTCIEKVYIKYGGYRICMIHNPDHADPTVPLNFCGHIHNLYTFKQFNEKSDLINVGVDRWDFKLIDFNTIMKYYHKWVKGGRKNE